MATYKYAAVKPDGTRERGKIEGFSVAGVTADLLDRGLQEVKVRQRRSLNDIDVTTSKVKPVGLMHLSRQLAAFLRAGVPLLEALDVLQEDIKDKTLKTVLLGMGDSLRRGENFSEAAAPYEKVFPPFYVGVLRSAELTGHLDDVLDQLAKYIERDLEAKRKIKSALAYPAIVMVLSIVVVIVLIAFVLPRFKDFFESFNAKLPLPTRMLIAVTSFLSNSVYTIVGLALVFVVAVVLGIKTRKGREIRDLVLLKAPVLGEVVRYAVIERFCRMLGSMVQAGIPLPDAMTIAAAGSNNLVYERGLTQARQAMLQGEGMAGPIAETKLFPGSANQMIRVGEETGTLDDQLEVTASFFAQELEYKLKNFTNLFEPMMIIAVGVVVGFVAIALVSAIYGIYNQVEL